MIACSATCAYVARHVAAPFPSTATASHPGIVVPSSLKAIVPPLGAGAIVAV